ncbi:MAG: hypothetical protein HUU21_21390 [Polyangiaceae bacterium]|nr:hypothetical protein [Polyangiaceae bacterium]
MKFRSYGSTVGKIWHDGTSGVFDIDAGSGTKFAIKSSSNQSITLQYTTTKRIEVNATGIGFFAANPVAKPTVTGSRGGNAALASLLTALATLGLITDSSSP